MHRIAVTASLLAAIASAQNHNLTAHPQDSIQNSSGNLVPFGCLPAGNFAEGRTHVLIRAVELPGPGAVLLGMEAHGQNNATLTYLSLDINVSPTTATGLTTNFAGNLPAPQPVFTATNHVITWNGQWVPITFQTPYVHDGTSALVLEIKKTLDPATLQFMTCSTNSNPSRGDLPSMAYAFGNPGSGAANAANAAFSAPALAVRLHWANAPTIRLLSDTLTPGGNQFAIGGSLTHTLAGTPNHLFVNLVAQSFLSPPQSLPPVLGEWRVNGPTTNLGLIPASGEVALVVSIPNNPVLVGEYFTWQSLTVDSALTAPQFTNAVDNFIRQ